MDYSDFKGSKSGKQPKPKPGAAESAGKAGFWWKEPEATARADSISRAAAALESDQSARHNMNLLHARMYGNFDISGFGARQYMRGNTTASSRIAFNVTESGVDTLAAKISKHRPRAVCATDGAKFDEQQKAKRLGQFIDGMFSYARVYEKDDDVFVSAGVLGTGGYKIVMDDENKVNLENVFIDEILVDEADARYGKPRQLIHGRLCHRETLIAQFPHMEAEIRAAKPPNGVERGGFGDMVQVWEAWHLRSGKKAGDGKHAIVLDGGAELLCEDWVLDRFPFVFYKFKPRLLGFWGQGVAEMLTGIQLELNRLVRSVSDQLKRKGRGRVFMPLSAKVPPEHMTNAIGDIIFFNGNVPPVVDNANQVAPEEFMQIERLYAKAFQIIGVSEMSVSAKKPSGLDAAVALREFEEIESERFAKQHQRWDNFHMELAEAMVDFVRVFGGPDYVTRYEHKRYMQTIKWSDVKHEPGEYSIKMMPSSNLPQTPAARRQAVKELELDGRIDKATALRLLDLPDLESQMNLGLAAQDDVDFMIDKILNGEPVEAPDKYTNLDLLVEHATAMYLFARNHGADEKVLDNLCSLIDMAAATSAAAKAPIMPPAPTSLPMPGEMPGGQGGAPGNINVTGQEVNMPPQPAVPPLIA